MTYPLSAIEFYKDIVMSIPGTLIVTCKSLLLGSCNGHRFYQFLIILIKCKCIDFTTICVFFFIHTFIYLLFFIRQINAL